MTTRISAIVASAVAALTMNCNFNQGGTPLDPTVDAAQPNIDADPNAPDADPNAPDAAPLPDAPMVMIDAPPGCMDWGYTPNHFDPCTIVPPSGDLVLTSGVYTYNTGTGVLTGGATNPAGEDLDSLSPTVRLISVMNLEIQSGATLRVEGPHPLLIASWGDITVDGIIDVSSSLAKPGAGSGPSDCMGEEPTAGGQDNNGGGGGGGGGFQGDGGEGGLGGKGNGDKGLKGEKLDNPPTNIRGGCSGAGGGIGDRMDGAGVGGPGGGAVYLAAKDSIMVTGNGVIHAGGAGGQGAEGDRGGNDQGRRSGGGGGGSGGYIAVQAPDVNLATNSVLAANGGGGGGGCHNDDTSDDGEDGAPNDVAADGGPFGGGGNGVGGAGGVVDREDALSGASPNDNHRGGGGGGGGVGFIFVYSTNLTDDGIISPDPEENPLE